MKRASAEPARRAAEKLCGLRVERVVIRDGVEVGRVLTPVTVRRKRASRGKPLR